MPTPVTARSHPTKPQLNQVLNSWQIFFIAISGTVGTGIFSTNGSILSHAGPGGYILSLGFIGLVGIAFMDGLSEMAQAFPCANALAEYVDAFVDPELATCVGIAYWIVWGLIWALMIEGAATSISFWTDDLSVRILVFFILTPVLVTLLNLCHVNLFGRLETLGGGVKVLAIIAVSLAIFYLAGKSGNASDNFYRGFLGRNPSGATAAEICFALPTVAYSWIGLEIVAVSAFEAKSFSCLRGPSQAIVICVLVLYLVCAIGESLALESNNSNLPNSVNQRRGAALAETVQNQTAAIKSNSVIVIAAVQNNEHGLARFFNGILLFSALSAANTSMYVASRALYGLALKKRTSGWQIMEQLSRVHRFGVPWVSVLCTALVFGWIPFLQLQRRPAGLLPLDTAADGSTFAMDSDRFAEWLRTFSSILGLIVWNTLCLAYIRYYHLIRKYHKHDILTKDFKELNRFKSYGRAETMLGIVQPFVAYFGFAATLILIFIFPSAAWWGEPAYGFQVTQTYAAPILTIISWLLLKLYRRLNATSNNPFEWYAKISDDEDVVWTKFQNFKILSGDKNKNAFATQHRPDEETGSALMVPLATKEQASHPPFTGATDEDEGFPDSDPARQGSEVLTYTLP